ncbi:MAG: FAD-binding oxidoreductase, partial [Thermodesulfobacteriota bacterium]
MLQAEARNRLINILGEDNFADNQEELIAYSFDATKRQALPEAVVFPSTVEQVAQVLALANQERIPVVPRGAGSGMSGGSVPVHGGIVLVLQGFDRILELDADNLVAVVQPGVVTQKLQQAAQEKGLFYPPDPASMAFSSIGGNIAENSGGLRAVKYGVTRDYVLGLEVVLPNGQIIQTGSKCIKDVVGYNLTQLFVGSEGTLGVITQAILRLLPLPKASQTLSATFPSMLAAANTVSEVLRQGLQPTAMEFLDRASIWSVSRYLDLGLPEKTQAFLLVELDGDPDLIQKNIQQVQEVCMSNQALQVSIAADKKEQEELWRARRSVSASLAHHGAVVKLNEDIVVPRASLPEMITAIEE